ncbi:RagB/SusD family nutrient uptake outer membrane protein [Pedobacter hiemivivus]|uniref:RagB/SusD family nutrient uptake outer membrane protein n=1 Tax=Pedobacter hiemivivus TaxID=2530454 RepID=A0A4R0NBF3_9SPHI|nr:RagB/SusD family nutrient uptake outer membrane protein [Pedobacter hiemivivus]TCC96593.1 RagB/SusD family nutrient uptake outer membrane protein [Pedobacter hiemivivus]
MKNIKKIFCTCGLGLLMILSVPSCKLDEYNPNALAEEEVLRDFNGFRSFQSNIYTGLWGTLISMPYGIVSEVGTDLWTSPTNSVSNRQVMAYEEFTNNFNLVTNTWDYAWGSIKDCNKTIEMAPLIKDGNATDIKTLVAEAQVMRAYYYSVLVAQFGNIPLITTAGPVNLTPVRNSVADVYTQIISDLTTGAQNLPVTPYQGNLQRVTKKSALGLLARAYAQGGGEGLMEGTKSYWLRAKEVAEDLILNKGAYGATMYADFAQVFAAANNRNNAEVLFTAYGLNPYNASYDVFTGNNKPNLYLHYYPSLDNAFGAGTDLFRRAAGSNTSNAYYGRLNQSFIAPTKYLINCFNATYDKRWENSFVTAFTNYSGVQAKTSNATPPSPANVTYADATVTLNAAMCTKYGINPAFIGQKIYPYADVDAKNASPNATWQYISKVWPKGVTTGATSALVTVANANVHPYPLDVDEDRFFAFLSKDQLSPADKALRKYAVVNINDLFDPSDPTGAKYKDPTGNGLTPLTMANLFPALSKFNHNFDGGWLGGNFQQKLGNIMVMRMAEVYLLAAEATLKSGGSAGVAAGYLNELRKRACRNPADFNAGTGMMLSTATMNDVFDEYARELCGEFNRWALLKRHRAFETRLALYNRRAAASFNPAKHYNRPIPFNFLNTINNGDEFGNNGY